MSNLTKYLKLIRFYKPIGTWLLLWPALMALILCDPNFIQYKIWLIVAAGAFVTRSLGCIINDIWDKDIDCHVARTKDRPVTNGSISLLNACIFALLFLVSAIFLALQLNPTAFLPCCFSLFLMSIYPLMKRYTNYPQFILGIAFASSILVVASQFILTSIFPLIILYAAVSLWVIAFDTQYAINDKKYDEKIGVKSTAIAWGAKANQNIFYMQSLSCSLFALLGFVKNYSSIFYLFLITAYLLCLTQKYQIDTDSTKSFSAFLNNNYIGLLITIGMYFG